MADEPATTGSDAESASSKDEPQNELIYESNPKHSEPWQIGKKGSPCEREIRPLAARLLRESVLWQGKRYAVHDGRAYCARASAEPVAWISCRMGRRSREVGPRMG